MFENHYTKYTSKSLSKYLRISSIHDMLSTIPNKKNLGALRYKFLKLQLSLASVIYINNLVGKVGEFMRITSVLFLYDFKNR